MFKNYLKCSYKRWISLYMSIYYYYVKIILFNVLRKQYIQYENCMLMQKRLKLLLLNHSTAVTAVIIHAIPHLYLCFIRKYYTNFLLQNFFCYIFFFKDAALPQFFAGEGELWTLWMSIYERVPNGNGTRALPLTGATKGMEYQFFTQVRTRAKLIESLAHEEPYRMEGT